MFYSDTFSPYLRFGDVLKGFMKVIAEIDEPILSKITNFNIKVENAEFCIVMDPCCNIDDGTITLTPLKPINKNWLFNPYLENNIVSLNSEIKPIKAIHPDRWNSLKLTEKQNLYAENDKYQQIRYFIYDIHNILPVYKIEKDYSFIEYIDDKTKLPAFKKDNIKKSLDLNYYMIDFKNIYYVNCKRISNPRQKLDEQLSNAKVLELSIESRNLLRDKLAFWYYNRPEEDVI